MLDRLLVRLARSVVRHRRRTLIGGLVVLIVAGVVATGALGSMVLSRWEAPGTESVLAQDRLESSFGTGSPNVILLVTARSGSVESRAVTDAGLALEKRLAGERQVGDAWSYWSSGRDRAGRDPTMRGADGDRAIVLGFVEGSATEARARIAELIPAYTVRNSLVDVQVAGGEAASTQISALAARDFVRAELLIVPLMLILMVLVYRRVVPSLLTLGVGLFSVVGTLAGLRILTSLTEVSTFAANITLVMGIGLGIDYSLFVIARFREELSRGLDRSAAVVEAVRTAGHTVVWSGLTVAVSLAALLLIPYDFLRSFAYAGILIVLTAVVGALVLLPAALGPRSAGRGPTGAGSGLWHRFGAQVMRRPLAFGGAALVLLLALAAPVLGLRIGLPDDRVLPPSASTRQAYDDYRAHFAQEPNDAIHFVARSSGAEPRSALVSYARELSRVPGVAQVNSPVGAFVSGELSRAVDGSRYRRDGVVRLEAVPTRAVLSGTSVDSFVASLRAVPSPYADTVVGGDPAELTDFRTVLMNRLPWVGVFIGVLSFAVLLAMTRSVLLPLKAVLLNGLSLAVMFGVLVVVFQNGALSSLLGFTAIGTLDPAMPILMLCIVFGLSMDYEVYMLSRIREEYDRTGDNRQAVLTGLQRSAPLITAAAGILALSFSLYATGEIAYLKMIGIGTAVAIIVDATVIRAVCVPALMRLAGRANWWFPGRRGPARDVGTPRRAESPQPLRR